MLRRQVALRMLDFVRSNVDVSNNTKVHITVGMPVYNGMPFIEHALRSLLGQTYSDFNIIISDNDSTDGTWDLIQNFAQADRRIQLHRQVRNVGARKNFFDVLARADTELFMWHAHDDWISPNFLEDLVRIMDENPDCQLAAPSVCWRDFDGRELQYWPFPDLGVSSPLQRARRLLQNPVGGWVYGVFRTHSLRCALRYASGFRHVLAFDRVLLLQFILSDTLRGCRDAEINCLITQRTQQDYLPRDLYRQMRIIADYMLEHAKAISRSPFPFNTKMKLIGPLLQHRRETFYMHWSAIDNAGVRFFFRLQDVRRNPYRFLIKRPKRWLVSRVKGLSSSPRSSAPKRSRDDASSLADSDNTASRGSGERT